MADDPFNVVLGRAVELYNRVESNDPANSALVVMLLKTAEADAVLRDYNTFAAILAQSPVVNVEADFTNYTRKFLTDSDLAALPSPDDTNDRYDIDLPDIIWSSAGGASNNNLSKLIIGYLADASVSPISDASIIPMGHYDFAATTNGNDLQATIDPLGFYRASKAT